VAQAYKFRQENGREDDDPAQSLVIIDQPRHKERNASCLVALTVAPSIPTHPDDAVA
jgi:hypothetical protein